MFNIFGRRKKLREEQVQRQYLEAVEILLKNMRYRIEPYGAVVAVTQLYSGYKPADVASFIALMTLARDVKYGGDDVFRLLRIFEHGMLALEQMKWMKDNALMHPTQWQNDSTAIMGIITVDAEQIKWTETVLSDPIGGKDRLAWSLLEY